MGQREAIVRVGTDSRRLTAATIVAALAGVTALIATAAVVTTAPTQYDGGYEVVPVWLSSSGYDTVSGLQFEFAFDQDAYEFTDVLAGETAVDAGKDVAFAEGVGGTVRVLVMGFNQDPIGDGIAAYIYLKPIPPKTVSGGYGITGARLTSPLGSPVEVETDPSDDEEQANKPSSPEEASPETADEAAEADATEEAATEAGEQTATESPSEDTATASGGTFHAPSSDASRDTREAKHGASEPPTVTGTGLSRRTAVAGAAASRGGTSRPRIPGRPAPTGTSAGASVQGGGDAPAPGVYPLEERRFAMVYTMEGRALDGAPQVYAGAAAAPVTELPAARTREILWVAGFVLGAMAFSLVLFARHLAFGPSRRRI